MHAVCPLSNWTKLIEIPHVEEGSNRCITEVVEKSNAFITQSDEGNNVCIIQADEESSAYVEQST